MCPSSPAEFCIIGKEYKTIYAGGVESLTLTFVCFFIEELS